MTALCEVTRPIKRNFADITVPVCNFGRSTAEQRPSSIEWARASAAYKPQQSALHDVVLFEERQIPLYSNDAPFVAPVDADRTVPVVEVLTRNIQVGVALLAICVGILLRFVIS